MENKNEITQNVIEIKTAAQSHKLMQEKAELLAWLHREEVKALYHYELIKSRK